MPTPTACWPASSSPGATLPDDPEQLAGVPTEGPDPGQDVAVTPGGVLTGRAGGFAVRLDNFEGPFDLLLGLISKHKLDVTEIALAQVTDDFVAYIRDLGAEWDLGEASEFLLVAATLLDLKAARLLPAAEVEDDEDLALLEARDLLFARLLQYRAFKEVAATFSGRLKDEALRSPRAVPVEPQFAQLLPELVLGISPEAFAMIAAKALTPRPAPTVTLDHLHAPAVSVREQAALIVDRLRRVRASSFRALVSDANGPTVVVARFLALLELFRESAVVFDQVTPLGELTIRWTGSDEGDVTVEDEFDDGSIGQGIGEGIGVAGGDAPGPAVPVARDGA